jgi:hypothetical protein
MFIGFVLALRDNDYTWYSILVWSADFRLRTRCTHTYIENETAKGTSDEERAYGLDGRETV